MLWKLVGFKFFDKIVKKCGDLKGSDFCEIEVFGDDVYFNSF